MTYDDLEKMYNLVKKRQQLGGFDTNADDILLLAEMLFKVIAKLADDEMLFKAIAKLADDEGVKK